MKTAWTTILAIGFACGCAQTGSMAGDSNAGEQRLRKVAAEHADIDKRLTSAPADDRSQCEVSAGDCLLQAAEQRAKLVSRYSLNACEQSNDIDAKARCIGAQLTDPSHRGELIEYYAFENWCMNKIVVCTSQRAELARLAALEERSLQRKQQLEVSAEGISAWNAVELVRAKVEYLRTSLPPKAAGVCPPSPELERCAERFEAEQKALDVRLRQDDYDAKSAVTDYAASKLAVAACQQPQLECLSSAVGSYGVYPEARKWVDRNLALLAQRQKLSSVVSAEAQGECLAEPQQEHQARIVEAYATYAHQTVLYFRVQLDQAFIALHEAQVGCLTAKSKAAPPVPVAGPLAKQ